MRKMLAFLGIAGLVFLMACAESAELGADGLRSEQQAFRGAGDQAASSRAAAPAPAPAVETMVESEAIMEVAADSAASSANALETVQRKVISTALVSMEVEVVQAAIVEVRVIAESLGGFVEQLTSSGGPERQRATMTIRVPQAQFSSAMERIEALGKVQSKNEGSEDVSERFIDLQARLKSSHREEQSLLSLLEKTDSVSEVLAIERELSRVRSDIERFQGQLNFLERRVDLATITVSLMPPEEALSEPPSATLVIEVPDVTNSVGEVKALVSSRGGVLDEVVLSVRNDRERAEISLEVFTADFQQVVDFLESQGEVRSKELREGTPAGTSEKGSDEKPDARIEVSVVEESTPANVWVILAIAVPVGGIGLAMILVPLLYFSYRAGTRRRPNSG